MATTPQPTAPKDPNQVPAYTAPEIKIDVMGRKFLWFGISGLVMLPGIIAMLICMSRYHAPVKPGIDFTGGTLLQLHFEQPVKVEQLRTAVAAVKVKGEGLHAEIQNVIENVQRTSTGS